MRTGSTPPLWVALTLLVGLAAACEDGGGSERPNVLLVTLDTTRADFLSCYDPEKGWTPTFDSLAEEGARFSLAVSASAVTPVSHATILTGLFPYRHGLRVLHADGGFRLPKDRWYLPEALSRAGYATAAVHSAFPVSGYFGFERSFDEFHGFDGALDSELGAEGTSWDLNDLQRRSDRTTDLAIEVLEGLSEPFFLWLHYWDPHDGLRRPPLEFFRASQGDPERLRVEKDAGYALEVSYLDQEFGRLVAHLEQEELLDETLVVVTADHGEGLSDGFRRHGWRAHRMLYQEQIHVPLIVRPPRSEGGGPGSVPRGVVVDSLVRTADVAPTILDYLDLPVGEAFDGASLRPLIEGERPDEPRIAYADQINGYDSNAHLVQKRPDAAFLYTLTDGEWKLTYRPHMPELGELYHLPSDPGEVKNLYAKRPGEVRRLLADLARREPWVTRPFPPDGDGAADAGAREALGALGYAAGPVADARWAWTCPEHDSLRLDDAGRCPQCGGHLVPVRADD